MNAKHSLKTYCIVCKKDTENKNPKVFKTKNGRLIFAQCVIIKNQDLFQRMMDLASYYL